MSWRPAHQGETFNCLTVRLLRDKGIVVPCGVCAHCRALRGKDKAGRIIAESLMADRTLFATLTVGGSNKVGDNLRAQEFHRDDVMKSIDRERKYIRPGRMRMFWCGEKGGRFGRTHYHMVKFYYGTQGPENLLLNKNYFHGKMLPGVMPANSGIPHWDGPRMYWPHGFSNFSEFTPRAAYYLAAYATKLYQADGSVAEYMRPGISTKPLLGALWFKQFAVGHVEHQLAPQGRTYSFPRAPNYTGALATYYMGDATWKLFVREYLAAWRLVYGDRPWPYSPAIEEHLEKLADEEAAKVPLDEGYFDQRMEAILNEKAEHREKLAEHQKVVEHVKEAIALERAGIKPVLKKGGIDDALNAALAGNIDEEEFKRRFGSFDDHVARWQMEALRRQRR